VNECERKVLRSKLWEGTKPILGATVLTLGLTVTALLFGIPLYIFFEWLGEDAWRIFAQGLFILLLGAIALGFAYQGFKAFRKAVEDSKEVCRDRERSTRTTES
jgi:hypothetical protein